MSEHHRHEWLEQQVEAADPERGEAATVWRFGCRACAEVVPACETCARPNESANRACRACIEGAARVLADVDEAARVPFAAEVLGVRAVRYDRAGGKGGRRSDALPFGLDAVLTDPDAPEELHRRMAARPGRNGVDLLCAPENVLDVLHGWAADWAEKVGSTTSGQRVTAWLAAHLVWAANNPQDSDWAQYLDEAQHVRRRLRRLVGLAPEIEPGPCVMCGGHVVRDWSAWGLSDIRRCTGCGTTWGDREHLDFANLTHLRELPRSRPDQLVTVEGARAALPTARRGQLRLVMHRDQKRIAKGKAPRVPVRGKDERGRPLYRIADAWIAADPDAGVTVAEAVPALPPEHRDHLARLLAVDVPDSVTAVALLPRGRLNDGTPVYRLGTLAEVAARHAGDAAVATA